MSSMLFEVLDSMSPARSRRSAIHALGTHGWLPQTTCWPGHRRGGVGGYNFHSHPDYGTPTTSRLYPFGVSRHNHYVHRKLHQGTQSLHNICKSPIPTTSIQNWCYTRWRPFTNTMQHFHCRHTTTYADNVSMISTHTSTSAAKKYIHPYLHKVLAWTKQNNLTLNPDKTTCTLFTPDPAEYKSNLDLKINNTALPMAKQPKVPGLTLHPKFTYRTHIHNISVQAHNPLQMLKALTATGLGKTEGNTHGYL